MAVHRAPRLDGHTGGNFIVTGTTAAAVADVAKQTGVDFTGLKGAVPPGTYEIRKPRIAMYQRYGGGNMDEGWTRLMLEQFGFPYKSLMDAEIKSGALETKYDAIILPSDSINAMTGEPQAGGPGGGRGGGPSNTPPEYRSGLVRRRGGKALQPSCRRAARWSPSRSPATCRSTLWPPLRNSWPVCRRRNSGAPARPCE